MTALQNWIVATGEGGKELEIPALERQLQAATYSQPRAEARDGR